MSPDLNTRQNAILNQIRRQGRVLVEDLAQAFLTTPQTIRRDLQILADTGEVMRFHGGASLLPGVEYTSFDVRQALAAEQKAAIAREVALRIPSNTVVMINGGTTSARVARALQDASGLRVITDNINIANTLRMFSGVETMVPGGNVRRSDGAIVGETAVEFLRQFRADVAVIGAAAIDPEGTLLDFDLREVAVARAMIEGAKHVILACDSSKFSRSAPVRICDLRQVHTFVTDACQSPAIRELCVRHEVELVEAMPG